MAPVAVVDDPLQFAAGPPPDAAPQPRALKPAFTRGERTFRGICTAAAAVSLVIIVSTKVVLRTRQFAVRQERWFRRDPRIRWVQVEHDPVTELLPVIDECLH